MSLDKAIKSRKEHRKPYRKSKALDLSCRNHGGCPACESNRNHATRKRLEKSKQSDSESLGELTANDTQGQYLDFFGWLLHQKYKKKILISGNHDNELQNRYMKFDELSKCEYLCDSGTEFEGLKIWGSPWTKTFPGMNPHCKAFTCDTEEELAEKWDLIPANIDILITHSPPYSILDKINSTDDMIHVGSESLKNVVLNGSRFINLKLHVFGHIHEQGGKALMTTFVKFTSYKLEAKILKSNSVTSVNASIVNEKYEHVNKPVRVVL